MGVNRFIPFICTRTVVKLSGKRAAERVSRWNDICRRNSGFSLRSNVPKVEDVLDYAEILNMPGFGVKYIFYEEQRVGGTGFHIAEGASVLALVGPEGGFDPAEIEAAKAAGFRVASLGAFVLKAEVAAAKAISLILNMDKYG
jgi:16S rRNA (uracil1498-N3)-methyltransferase